MPDQTGLDLHPLNNMLCRRCDVDAAFCPCETPHLTAEEWVQIAEWNDRSGLTRFLAERDNASGANEAVAVSVEDEWYPHECPFCTRAAALACTDPVCRAAHLGEPRQSKQDGDSEHA